MLPECKITLIPWWNTFWKGFRQWVHSLILQSESIWGSERCWEVPQEIRASQVALVVKNPPANAGDIGDVGDVGSIPVSGRFPEEGNDNPLQCSCLENPMDGGAWRATVHRVAKSWTRLKRPSTHARERNLLKSESPISFSETFFQLIPVTILRN